VEFTNISDLECPIGKKWQQLPVSPKAASSVRLNSFFGFAASRERLITPKKQVQTMSAPFFAHCKMYYCQQENEAQRYESNWQKQTPDVSKADIGWCKSAIKN
jgi:hypothetical protein